MITITATRHNHNGVAEFMVNGIGWCDWQGAFRTVARLVHNLTTVENILRQALMAYDANPISARTPVVTTFNTEGEVA